MVVLIPGMGDDIQAIKAGILEIGDVVQKKAASCSLVMFLMLNFVKL